MPTFTYTGSPSASVRDEVRFLAGDRTEGAMIVSDEEIDYLIDQYGKFEAAAQVAESMATHFGMKAELHVGKLFKSYKTQAATQIDNAKRLRANARRSTMGPALLGGGGHTLLGPARRYERPLNWGEPYGF